VDSSSPATNVYPMQFETDQAAFLAGYLAAGYSKTGKVATFGGLKIPPVTVFMDGFVDGVAYYNKAKGKNVQVLGWDKTKQNGSFTNDFASTAKGKALASTFVSQGADIVMPVAGGTGLGAAEVAKASGGKVSIIWVDQDGCKSAAQDCDVFLTTVEKNVTDAVQKAVVAGAQGQPLAASPGYLGTLENGGVGLAGYNQFASKVDSGLQAEVEKLKQDIISGTVKVQSANAPAA
jgi:basic membrane protein A